VLLQHHTMDVMKGNFEDSCGKNMTSCALTDGSTGICSTKAPFQCQMTNDASSSFEDSFKHAASFNYIGNLIFRVAHNFVFAWAIPRHRVYISLGSMFTAMGTISIAIYALESTSVGWIYLAYLIGGVGVGTFESNLLSCITPLGHDTKVWAIIGMPVGFMLISVLGFFLRSPPPVGANVDPLDLYIAVMCLIVIGSLVFCFYIPISDLGARSASEVWQQFVKGAKEWRNWFPVIRWNCLALMVDMYCVSVFTSMPFYIYNNDWPDGGLISLVHGTASDALMNHDRYFAIVNIHTFLGDTISRKVAYYYPVRNGGAGSLMFIALAVTGAVLCLLRMPILLWPGLFMIFYANGGIYATTTKHIDQNVPKEYNLIALSLWLFIGDVGSVTGSNTWEFMQPLLCDGALGSHDWKYFCIKDN